MTIEAPGGTLAELRREVDRIDGAMHRLLIERGEIVDRLIAAKRSAETGSAFRPDREAAMMRALALRHTGRLPLDAVEGVWRVIISTFTHLQAPFAVHLAGGPEGAALRDSARFHFGFTVPCQEEESEAAVVAAVAASRGDVGLLRLGRADVSWWRALEAPDAPKAIARLPFVEREGHPAGLPVLVVAREEAEAGPDPVRFASVRGDGRAALDDALAPLGGSVVADVAERDGIAALVGLPDDVAGVAAALAAAGIELRGIVGRAPAPFAM